MSERVARAAALGSSAGQALQQVLAAREHEKLALERAETWRRAKNIRVAKAMQAGVPAETLAENLGVTVQRVYQMRAEASKS